MSVLNGRYEPIEVVGRGDNGQLWRAWDSVLAGVVAVKTLDRELFRRPECRTRFRDEAQVTGALRHPGIVAPYDHGFGVAPDDPALFLVTEYVEGPSLAEVVRAGPVPVGRAVAIARDVADALACAHRARVLHGAVRPTNVLLTEAGAVKVRDFGAGRMATDPESGVRANVSVGTLTYMAPEQVRAEPVDARTDVHALGTVLFELLCGRPPVVSDSAFKLLMAQRKAAPKVSGLRAGVPSEVDEVVGRMLARDPAYRFRTMAEVSAALDACAGAADAADFSVPPLAPPSPRAAPARRSWWSRNRRT